jgi:hypothetical protein
LGSCFAWRQGSKLLVKRPLMPTPLSVRGHLDEQYVLLGERRSQRSSAMSSHGSDDIAMALPLR